MYEVNYKPRPLLTIGNYHVGIERCLGGPGATNTLRTWGGGERERERGEGERKGVGVYDHKYCR